MTDYELNDLDYSYHIDGEETLDEPWMDDPETLEMLAECDRLYEGVEQ